MKHLVSLLVAGLALAVPAFAAQDYYVNNTEGVGSDDYDGKAPAWDGTHGPKFRIQAAINAASSGSGDVIHIAAGTYGDDQGYVAKADAMGYYDCRLCIAKNITIVGAGRGKTILLGKLADTDTKSGTGALPGLLIGTAGKNCRISGITFRDCASNSSYQNGTAVLFTGSGREFADMPWIADCAFENCYSGGGAVACVNVARTIVSDCLTSDSASVGCEANFVHCIFTRNSHGLNNSAPIKDNPLLRKGRYVINCTFARNSSATAVSSAKPTCMYNCVVVESTVNASIRAENIFNCVSQSGDTALEATAKGDNVTGRNFQLAAPIFDDYRPVADLTVFSFSTKPGVPTAGKLAWLDGVPEEFRLKDFHGNPVVADEEGRICAGAVQTKMYPTTGIYSSQLVIDGHSPAVPRKTNKYETYYAMFDEWPRVFRIEAMPERKAGLYSYFLGIYNGVLRFPEADGSAFLVLEKGHFSENATIRTATQELWVKKTGSDETGDGSEGNPYLTIQQAVDQVANTNGHYAVIHVGPGEYADGGKPAPDETQTNRVSVWQGSAFVAIRSTDGAARTVIRGKRSASANGLGPDAVRCVKMRNGQSQLQGFTLTDGYGADTADTTVTGGGAAFFGSGERTLVTDCVISNCFCVFGQPLIYQCTLMRCRVARNGAAKPLRPTNILKTSYAVNSVFVDNCAELTLFTDVAAAHCTFDEPLGNTMALASSHGYLANCIVGASYGTSPSTSKKKMLGSVFAANYAYNATDGVNVENVNFIKRDPCFADAAGRDLRLVSSSPAIGNALNAWKPGNGDWTDAQLYSNYYRWIAKDMEGSDPYFVNGKPTIGAYFKPATQAVKVTGRKGVTVATNVTSEQIGFDEEISVSATSAGRPLTGLIVNGELLEGVTSISIVPSEHDFAPVYDISAGDPMTWYADAVNGDDEKNDGWSEATAKKTIKAAFEFIEPGEKVVALPGTYDCESMTYGDDLTIDNVRMTLPARVIVPQGVTVESRDGAEKTVIRGEFADTETRVGEGAMRCVVLRPDSRIRGFTLTGGATYGEKNAANGQGGGVLSSMLSAKTASITCNIEDCIISNNVAYYYGGGGSNGNYYRCRFLGNTVPNDYGAGGVNEPKLLCDCVIDRNVGNYGAAETYSVVNCTFGANNVKANGSAATPLQCDPGSAVWKVYNTLFLGGGWSNVRWAYNCAMPTGYTLATAQTDPAKYARENIFRGDVPADADYRPLLASVAVDQADPGYRPAAASERDALGGQRVYNGALDIGALEADWRPQYAKDIAARLTVTDASPEVVESDSGTVLLSEGTTLEATWKGRPEGSTGYTLNFRVAEGGSAEVTVNGETKTFGAGLQSYAFDSESAVCELAVAATAGEVEILKSRRNLGMCVIVR